MPQKRSFRRKRTYRRGLTPTQKKQVKKIAQAPMERKRWPVYHEGLPISTTHFVDDLLAVPQGDTEQSRDGDAIKITYSKIMGQIIGNDSTNIVRMTIIRWRANSVPTAAEIYDDTTINANGALFSPFNHKFRDQFVVLKDRYFKVEGATYGNIQKMFYVTLKSQPKTVFNGNLTTGMNKIYIIWSSDSGTANHPTITYRGDIHYLDC